MSTRTASLIPTHDFQRGLLALPLGGDFADRVRHVMEIGRTQLVTDVQTFEAAAVEFRANPPEVDPTSDGIDIRGPHFAVAMESMVMQFIGYINETDEILALLDAVRYSGGLRLALVTDDVAEAKADLDAVREQVEG